MAEYFAVILSTKHILGGISLKTCFKPVSYVLSALLLLSIAAGSSAHGLFGVDVVSAATGNDTPAKKAETKTTTKHKAQTTAQAPTSTSRLLALGSTGSDVKALQTMLNNNGYGLKVDGVFGKLTLAAVKDYQSKNGLAVDGVVGPKTLAKLNSSSAAADASLPLVTVVTEPTAQDTPPASDVATSEKTTIKMGRAEYAAHGTKCFTVAVVAMAGDKIVGASIDDYQFLGKDVAKGVPNSDKDFGKNYKDPAMVLSSKRANAAYYSENMKKEGGATIAIDKNFDAIESYAAGKTAAELDGTLSEKGKDKMVDAVSGATLKDTYGYVSAIIAAAKNVK